MKIFKKLSKWVKSKINPVRRLNLNDKLDLGIYIAQKLKTFLESPVVDIVVHITPQTWDEKLRAMVLKETNYIILAFTKFRGCNMKDTFSEKLECVAMKLSNLDKSERDKVLNLMGGWLFKHHAPVSKKELEVMVDARYRELKELGFE